MITRVAVRTSQVLFAVAAVLLLALFITSKMGESGPYYVLHPQQVILQAEVKDVRNAANDLNVQAFEAGTSTGGLFSNLPDVVSKVKRVSNTERLRVDGPSANDYRVVVSDPKLGNPKTNYAYYDSATGQFVMVGAYAALQNNPDGCGYQYKATPNAQSHSSPASFCQVSIVGGVGPWWR